MKKFGFRFAGLVAVVGMFVMGSAALAQVASDTQVVNVDLDIVNEISVSPDPLDLDLNASNSETVVTYTTNDGTPYDIVVTAPMLGWSYTGSTLLVTTYPTLQVSAPTTGTLITALNVGDTPVVLAEGVQNVSEATIGVTLLAAGDAAALAAGTYSTTLTYTLE